jgi:plastocyanin
MKKKALAVVLAAATLMLVACGSNDDDSKESSDTTVQQSAPEVAEVRAGMNDPKDRNVALLAFLPASVTVKTGASVEWTATGPEPHTITFLPAGQTPPTPDKPENAALRAKTVAGAYDGTQTLGSTIIPTSPKAETYKVSFPKAGDFTYYCIIHPGMSGTVKVVDDAATADAQSAIDARAKTEETKWLAEGRAAKKALLDAPVKKTANTDGSTTWTVEMGTNTQHTAVLAFSPPSADIKAGDKVTFVNNSHDPHTASFKGTKELPANPESPEAMAAAPGKSPQTLNATDLFNSGWLPPNAPPGAGPPEAVRSFTFVVPKAGEYSYVCILHAPSGMGGTLKAS